MFAQGFHLALHGRPPDATAGPAVTIEGREVARLVASTPLGQTPLAITFEEAEARLRRLPRLYFEPDGSFGWYAAPDEPRWNLGGQLFDRGDCLMYAEIFGRCPPAEFRQLLAAFTLIGEPPIVQLVSSAIFLDADDVCRLLASGT